jgi:hypothetical protein
VAFSSEGRVQKADVPIDPERTELQAVRSFRNHLAWYAHGLFGASTFRGRINTLEARADVESAVEQFFLGARVDQAAQDEDQGDIDYRSALG